MADYAERRGDQFVRVESITKTTNGLRYLDLGEEAVRQTVRDFDGAEVAAMYYSDVARDFK